MKKVRLAELLLVAWMVSACHSPIENPFAQLSQAQLEFGRAKAFCFSTLDSREDGPVSNLSELKVKITEIRLQTEFGDFVKFQMSEQVVDLLSFELEEGVLVAKGLAPISGIQAGRFFLSENAVGTNLEGDRVEILIPEGPKGYLVTFDANTSVITSEITEFHFEIQLREGSLVQKELLEYEPDVIADVEYEIPTADDTPSNFPIMAPVSVF